MKKIYFIGIDSAPLWIIKTLSKKYDLKGFDEFKDGYLGELESTLPPVTAAAWPSIYTGLAPKEHGSVDFSVINKKYAKELLYYDAEKFPPFWDVLARKGMRCLVVTPAVALQKSKEKNVDFVTGWPLPPRYSSKELEDLAQRVGFEGEPDIGADLNSKKISVGDATRMHVKSIRARSEFSKRLIEKNNYDLAFICFTETDRIQHYSLSLKDWEAYVAPLYEEISKFMEWIIKRSAKEDAVIMLVSDHGAQPTKMKFLPNGWLVKEGFASLVSSKKLGDRKLSSVEKFGKEIKYRIGDRLVKSKVRRIVYEKLPAFIKNMGEKFFEDNLDDIPENSYKKLYESDFDMKKTMAFASVSSGPVGMIWINDSRFSTPAVSDREKAGVKEDLIKKLRLVEDGNTRLIKNIFDGEKYYGKSNNFIHPDILFEVAQGYTSDFSAFFGNKIFVEPESNRRGEHTRKGIIGILSLRKKIKIRPRNPIVYSIFPTIMKFFGIKSAEKQRPLI